MAAGSAAICGLDVDGLSWKTRLSRPIADVTSLICGLPARLLCTCVALGGTRVI